MTSKGFNENHVFGAKNRSRIRILKSRRFRLQEMKQRRQNKMGKELSETKMEQLNRQPIIESSVGMSEDKKWIVHKTTITDIKPVTYMEKVMDRI